MPGSLPNDGDFERLRAAALAKTQGGKSEAEKYKAQVKAGEEEDYDEEEDDEEDEDEDEGDEFGDQMDFSSVPVSLKFFCWCHDELR